MWDVPLSILNGAIGDYLAREGNGLATRMGWARVVPDGGHVVVLVYGLMCTDAIWRMPDGLDYGTLLARDLGLTPGYVHYNTGLPVEENGVGLAALLSELTESRAVTDLTLVGYSMGGLVVRHALAAAAAAQNHQAWLPLTRRVIFLGTPHGGAPLERIGRGLLRLLSRVDEPAVKLAGQVAGLRSAGIRDLGETMSGPLPAGIPHYMAAGDRDAMVPVQSATGASPHSHAVRVFRGLGHLGMAHDPEVYLQLRAWCEDAPEGRTDREQTGRTVDE